MIYPKEINWYPIPFFRLLIPLILGIFISIHIDIINYILIAIIPLFIFSVISAHKLKLFKWRWAFGIGLNLFLFCFGYLITYFSIETRWNSHYCNSKLFNESKELYVIGVVNNQPVSKSTIKTEILVQSIGISNDSMNSCNGKLLLYFDNTKDNLNLSYGDQFFARIKIKKTIPTKNEFDFDYSKYLFFQNIHYQSFVKSDQWVLLAKNKGNYFWHIMYHWRDQLVDILRVHLKGINELTVAEALIIGYRDEIPQEIIQAYVSTGAMHVLSVSGLHVGIVAILLERIFRTNNIKWKKVMALITVICIWIFALLSGASSSVLRAAVMFSILIFGKNYSYNINMYNILAVSAFILLIYRPFFFFDIGFQLSYLGLIGIMFFQPKLEKLWLPKNKIVWNCWQFTTAGFAAQLATMPISIFHFHQFPTYFWLSGLIVIPAATGILFGGIALFVVHFIPYIGWLVGYVLDFLLWITNNCLFLIQSLPGSLLNNIWFTIPQTILFYLALITIILGISLNRYRFLQISIVLLILGVLPFSLRAIREVNQKNLIVHLLRHGNEIDFVSGKKSYTLVIDSSYEKSGMFSIKNCRSYYGVTEEVPIENCDKSIIDYKPPFVLFENKLIFLGNSYLKKSIDCDIAILYDKFNFNETSKIHCQNLLLHPTLQKNIREKCLAYYDDHTNIIDIEKFGTTIIDLK